MKKKIKTLLRLPFTPGDMPTAVTKSYPLDDVDELQFADSVERFPHANWEREHQIELTCLAELRYIAISRPPALSPKLMLGYPPHRLSSLSITQELAHKDRLHATGDDLSVTRGDVMAMQYKIHWMKLSEPSWEGEMNLQYTRNHVLRY